jgi:hypothetical protein
LHEKEIIPRRRQNIKEKTRIRKTRFEYNSQGGALNLRSITILIILCSLSGNAHLFAQDNSDCVPPCSSGFNCKNGGCVSKCDPQCGEDQRCNDSGECIPINPSPTLENDSNINDIKYGWLRVNVPAKNVAIFDNGIPVGNGSIKIQLRVGIHKIVAKAAMRTMTEKVEIFEDDVSTASFDICDEDTRNMRFFMGIEAGWMLGKNLEFGPSHIVGIEVGKKHLLALSFNWGLEYSNTCMYGGGVNYLYTANAKDIFIARIGVVGGFWMEKTYIQDSYPYYGYSSYEDYFFGGPRIRLEVGYKHVYLTLMDATLLLGTSIKPIFNPGISFRF